MQFIMISAALLFCVLAVNNKWSWYIDFPQCRSFRERMGERGFVIYHHSMCAFVFILSAYKLL